MSDSSSQNDSDSDAGLDDREIKLKNSAYKWSNYLEEEYLEETRDDRAAFRKEDF